MARHYKTIPPGTRFGMLTVLAAAERAFTGRAWQSRSLCRCDCGIERIFTNGNLQSGNSTGCGCARLARQTTHGLANHKLYGTWKGMKDRCYNPCSAYYKDYGGRGIRVCERWLDPANFIADMEEGYKEGLTLDRIYNDGDYEPGNCRWATAFEQQWNTRKTVLIRFKDECLPLREAARLACIPQSSVSQRVARFGCTHQEAFDHFLSRKLLRVSA